MDFPDIPQNLNDWNMDTVNSLLDIPNIESEKLECKREISAKVLSKSICAMANTCGGFILIGLYEKKTEDGKKKYGYLKRGLDLDEDTITQQIASARCAVDPIPAIKAKCIVDGRKNYVIIHVPEEKPKKPLFVTDRGCYIRINSSSIPANRRVVMNLFEGLEKKRNIASLLASLKILKSQLGATMDYICKISHKDQTRPALVDVRFVIADVIKNQAFLVENKLFGNVNGGYVNQGILKVIQASEQLNAQIATYNSTSELELKMKIQHMFTTKTNVFSNDLHDAKSIIDAIISKCQNTIDKYE